jgi:hypothetical protein
MGCGFYSQFGANAAKVENEKILHLQVKANGSNPSQSPILNYKTVALPLS